MDHTQNDDHFKKQDGFEGQSQHWNELKDDVSGIVHAATEKTWSFVHSAKEQATHYADRRKDEAVQSISGFAQSLRETGKTLDDKPHVREFVDSAADGLEQLAINLKSQSLNDYVSKAQSHIQERPLTYATLGLVSGFILARFLKSSAEQAANLPNHKASSQGQTSHGFHEGRV